jgi:hypothetical protein
MEDLIWSWQQDADEMAGRHHQYRMDRLVDD